MKELIFRKAATLLKIDSIVGVSIKVFRHKPPLCGCLLTLPSKQIHAQSQR